MRKTITSWTLCSVWILLSSTSVFSGAFYAKEHLVRDLSNKVEWLRCSVGQQWDGSTCVGEVILMNHETINQAIKIADEQLGGSWRLPNLKELKSLVCEDCEPDLISCKRAKIDETVFPNTDARAYWTGQQNFMAQRHYWTVNFCTGHHYGRFYPEQEMAVRLLRDR